MTGVEPATPDEIARLRVVASFLARLLLRECDAELVREISAAGLLEELAGIGLVFPGAADDAALDALAAEYFEIMVNPADGIPLVQSLAEDGSYEGDAAKGMREIAAAADVTFDTAAAAGAPVDHLGVQLALWGELVGRDRGAAAEFHRRHLAWAVPALAAKSAGGFYGALLAAAGDLIACQAELD